MSSYIKIVNFYFFSFKLLALNLSLLIIIFFYAISLCILHLVYFRSQLSILNETSFSSSTIRKFSSSILKLFINGR